jgi:hypothetical protein
VPSSRVSDKARYRRGKLRQMIDGGGDVDVS